MPMTVNLATKVTVPTGVRGSNERSPSGGTPDPIAERRRAASNGVAAIPPVVNRAAPVLLARIWQDWGHVLPDLTRGKSRKDKPPRKDAAGDCVKV